MDVIKLDRDTCFKVVYSDGTETHVPEGILMELSGDEIILHNGTNRTAVLFAAMDGLLRFISMLGLSDAAAAFLEQTDNEVEVTVR